MRRGSSISYSWTPVVECLNEEQLARFADGSLEPEARARAEVHLSNCSSCLNILAELAQSQSGSSSEEYKEHRIGVASQLLPGTQAGRYTVLTVLGEGGMGVVYAAYDPTLDRRVALKLWRWSSASPEAQLRLTREGQVMARLTHPNVLAVYDAGTFEGQAFVAMEYVEGQTLGGWLKEAPRRQEDILERFVQAGRGLAAAHAAGVVHRDFKPDNVLLHKDGRVLVMDFGLARAEASAELEALAIEISGYETLHTREGTVLGTPAFMSPEQRAGLAIDARSDQYSFCVAMVRALGGAAIPAPHRGTVNPQTIRSQAEDLERSRVVNSSRRAAILRGLSPDPKDRFETMDALLDALHYDPTARRRRIRRISSFGAFFLVGAIVSVWLNSSSLPCSGTSGPMDAVWSPNVKESIQRAFASGASGFGRDAWAATQASVDAYGVRWNKLRHDFCEAARVHHTDSLAVLAQRNECLDQRLQELNAVLHDLSRADETDVLHAVHAVQTLPSLSECSGTSALLGKAHSRSQAAQVGELRRRLAEARAASSLGKYDEALALGNGILRDAAALGEAGLQAEAAVLISDMEELNGSIELALQHAQAGLLFAIRAGDDETSVRAINSLAWFYGLDMENSQRGREDLALAHAAIDRIGGQPALESSVENTAAMLALHAGNFEEATDHIHNSLKLLQAAGEPLDDLRSAGIYHNLAKIRLGAGDVTGARTALEKALGIFIKMDGQNHPDVATQEMLFADLDRREGKLASAEQRFHHALAIFTTVKPTNPVMQAYAEARLAAVLIDDDKLDEAGNLLEIATTDMESIFGAKSHRLVEPLVSTARLELRRGHAEESLTTAQRALAIVHGMPDRNSQLEGLALASVGSAQLALGRSAVAISSLERSATLLEKDSSQAQALAQVRFDLSQLLWQQPSERTRAKELALLARGEKRAGGLFRPDVEAWLNAHGVSDVSASRREDP